MEFGLELAPPIHLEQLIARSADAAGCHGRWQFSDEDSQTSPVRIQVASATLGAAVAALALYDILAHGGREELMGRIAG